MSLRTELNATTQAKIESCENRASVLLRASELARLRKLHAPTVNQRRIVIQVR